MKMARVLIIVIGIALPYLSRVPGGIDWIRQYTDTGLGGTLLLGAFNAITWGTLLGLSFLYRRPVSLLPAVILGFGFIAWAHFDLDLTEDAQSAIGLVMIPIFSIVPLVVGGVLGFILDRVVLAAPKA